MSDTNTWHGDPGDDPFAPETVEAAIARSLRPGTPSTRDTRLVRTLADAYTLPPSTDAALARGRARLARRAEALDTGGHQMTSSDTWPAPASSIIPSRPTTQPPQRPRRRLTPFETFLRTAAAVLVVALLGAGFYALLRSMQSQGNQPHPRPTPTHPPVSSTATATAIPAQPPAPAGVYVIGPYALFLLDPSTGAVEHTYPVVLSGQTNVGTPVPLPPSSQTIVGTPVVANGMVYFTGLDSLSGQASVIALSASSGAQLWRTQTVGRLAQLSLTDGVLYGGTEGTGTGSDTFYALRASDGHVLWTYQTATLRPPAVIVNGVVYLMDQPQQPNFPGEGVRALRASDGAQIWVVPLPQACDSADDEVVDAGMVFVACHAFGDHGQGGNGSLYGLRASDGTLVWHITTNGEPSGGLAAGAGLLYYSVAGKNAAGTNASGLFALNEASGTVHWQVPNGGGPNVLDRSTLYSGLGSDLAAFSASGGRVLWTYPLANQRIELYAPVIAGGVVYEILNERVVAISAANGSLLWRSPVLANQLLANQQLAPAGLAVVTGG